MQAKLLLEDGTLIEGKAFGSETVSVGEVVFTTGMTGYQEVLTDPSFCGQIVTMTYPLIGNYGIARDDFEAVRPFVHGFIVREHELVPSNWRAEYSLDYLLKEYDIPGISHIDTRMLTRKLRHLGTMKGIISTGNHSLEELKERMQSTPLPTDQVARVSTKQVYSSPGSAERIVVVDFGSKSGILRGLGKRGCDTIVVPHDTPASEIRRLNPDGILLSNGPGDPKDVPHAVEMVKELLGEFPIFGICLGHQLFALACGANTVKLKFGHRGGNHPVKDLSTNRCYITSQNHAFTVEADSLKNLPLSVTHLNNNDGSIEGLKHHDLPAFSVQFHPEGSPGPNDSGYLFDQFLEMIKQHKLNLPQVPKQALHAAAAKKGELLNAQK